MAVPFLVLGDYRKPRHIDHGEQVWLSQPMPWLIVRYFQALPEGSASLFRQACIRDVHYWLPQLLARVGFTNLLLFIITIWLQYYYYRFIIIISVMYDAFFS